ncbi:hypothetical protein EJ04DRAFT_252646 [Polyplosphaeria fusca]|uniref:Uncharacterized protein n=1 Tax=Polyplosphaeria fusca TaxID=682080 RepID=A0A9P4QZM0_9PLEO|nr:hypothetical protein EJ04DRAFT_252646 [Polyplosphaeria fusca]
MYICTCVLCDTKSGLHRKRRLETQVSGQIINNANEKSCYFPSHHRLLRVCMHSTEYYCGSLNCRFLARVICREFTPAPCLGFLACLPPRPEVSGSAVFFPKLEKTVEVGGRVSVGPSSSKARPTFLAWLEMGQRAANFDPSARTCTLVHQPGQIPISSVAS